MRRHVRKHRRALLAGGGQAAQRAGLQEPGVGSPRQHHLGLARHRRHAGRRAAAIRHMQQVDAGALLEHFDAELMLAAVAARGIGERRLLLARIFDELRHRLDRQAWIDRQEELVRRHARDRQQVLEHVDRHRRIDMRIDGDQAVGGHDQRVAVGLGVGGHFSGDIAVGAGAVLDEERLPHRLGQALRQEPRGDVGRPARRDRHQHLDRPRRILLRARPARPSNDTSASAATRSLDSFISVSPGIAATLAIANRGREASRACDYNALPNSVRRATQQGGTAWHSRYAA